MKGTAGNCGDSIRSDCFVSVEPATDPGIDIRLVSKVEVLYGNAIRSLCLDIFSYFRITNALVHIDDQGALGFVLAARLEAALKQVFPGDREYLPQMTGSSQSPTAKDRLRRSRLYIPGNSPKLMINAGIHGADGIILDLEDSVAPDKKAEARYLVRNALRSLDFGGAERMVRINQLPLGLEDLNAILPQRPNLILIPKCESASQLAEVDKIMDRLLPDAGFPVHLMPIIESALGVVNAYQIATASKRVVALAIGLEDYTADLGVKRTTEGRESLYARASVVNAAVAAGIQAIDSVFSDVGDREGLKTNIAASKALGFSGMGCIHPRQVDPINKGYDPDQEEIDRAKKIVLAWEEAEKNKLGVISLGTKMIDPPVAKRALRIITYAVKSGMLAANWREGNHD
ncbi:MAG: citrate lyase subunit beta [Bacteroidales bacterium]|nr:citrate lyase subunit beta [Bacteroidales bacterium]